MERRSQAEQEGPWVRGDPRGIHNKSGVTLTARRPHASPPPPPATDSTLSRPQRLGPVEGSTCRGRALKAAWAPSCSDRCLRWLPAAPTVWGSAGPASSTPCRHSRAGRSTWHPEPSGVSRRTSLLSPGGGGPSCPGLCHHPALAASAAQRASAHGHPSQGLPVTAQPWPPLQPSAPLLTGTHHRVCQRHSLLWPQ